jgi:dephospho-CoA kinase
MRTLGVTGGIGMGKSTVAALRVERGVSVVDTDDLARQLVEPGEPALREIATAFGPRVLLPHGELDRPALAKVVFDDAAARRQLETILHPRIQQRWQAQLAAWRGEGRSVAAVIIPLLFETAVESQFDLVVCIACTAATQQQRLRARGMFPDEIQNRIAAQLAIGEKLARAHRVIWNEGNHQVLARQCDRILAAIA